MNYAFFGSSDFSVYVLDELLAHGIVPSLIVTTPDKQKGRKLVLSPTPVKVWAEAHNIEAIDPKSLKNDNQSLIEKLKAQGFKYFLVASYGKIIPKEIFDIPERKTLNIHPSLLPKYRGASPIQSQILNDEKNIGVSIIQINEFMDEGPILAKKQVALEKWPIGRMELEEILAKEGARLFAHILPEWLQGLIDPIMQNDSEATYCEKISKEDGLLRLEDDPYINLLKIKAFEGWPGTYFYFESKGKNIRVIISEAKLEDGKLKIMRVVPEGKKEMLYEDFLRGQS
jgi:methionyl-tRNA formyltransferase